MKILKHLILANYHSILQITDKKALKRKDKYIALSNFSIYYTWENIKNSHNNNKFKISAPTWNEEFQLPDGSYLISNIQDYFEYIYVYIHIYIYIYIFIYIYYIIKGWGKTVNPSVRP